MSKQTVDELKKKKKFHQKRVKYYENKIEDRKKEDRVVGLVIGGS